MSMQALARNTIMYGEQSTISVLDAVPMTMMRIMVTDFGKLLRGTSMSHSLECTTMTVAGFSASPLSFARSLWLRIQTMVAGDSAKSGRRDWRT